MAEDFNNLSPGDNAPIRLRMGEQGYIGLKQFDGVILEQARKELQWPFSNKTYYEMSQDVTIGTALSLFETMISRVPWTVEVTNNASEDTKLKAKFLASNMDDMEHSWKSFIQEVSSMFTYGYCVNEKVFRRRLKVNGSRFNDGLIGIKKLPVRSQSTIRRWLFSDDGRDLVGLEQDINLMQAGYRYTNLSNKHGLIEIKRDKFLLFRTNPKRDNPEGVSPLSKCYVAWKYRKEIEQAEAIGITRGLGGIPYFTVPIRYMSPDATDEEKASYEAVKQIGRNLHNNEQSSIIFPALYDDQGKPLFNFELIGPPNASQYDTDVSIKRYDNKILQALFADVLQLGNESHGSFSLADSKTSVMAMHIEARLQEIADVLNHDLIPQLWQLNGWDTEELPYFQYGDLDEVSLEELSKAIQRMAAVGALEIDRAVLNRARESIGVAPKSDDTPPDMTTLPAKTTRSGDSFSTPTGGLNGTANSVASTDTSSLNTENKA